MDVLFWNVGKKLTITQKSRITQLISEHQPAIICLAEGTKSIADCQDLEALISNLSYTCYYSPTHTKDKKLNLNYSYISNGLKIFFNPKCVLQEQFSFSHQRENGRIVLLKTKNNNKKLSFIFLHNHAKSGNRESTYSQSDFLSSAASMIKLSGIIAHDEHPIIIGDFNLEPWDTLMRHESYFKSTFLLRHAEYVSRKNSSKKSILRKAHSKTSYFNPSTEVIISSSMSNLGGTFYKDGIGWALLDYVLYDKDKINLDYCILTKSSSNDLLNNDVKAYNSFINDSFDHLPILIKIP